MGVPAGGVYGGAGAADGQALRGGGGVLVAGVAGVAGACCRRCRRCRRCVLVAGAAGAVGVRGEGSAAAAGEEWDKKAETERGERVGLRGEERREVVGESRGAMTSPGMRRSTAAAHMTLFF